MLEGHVEVSVPKGGMYGMSDASTEAQNHLS